MARNLLPKSNCLQPILSMYWDDEEADERGRREAKQRNRLNQCLLPSKEPQCTVSSVPSKVMLFFTVSIQKSAVL